MNDNKSNNDYFITYSNYLIFDGVKLAFRKKELFNINTIPIHIPFNINANCWIVNRKQLTLKKVKELLVNEPQKIDVSELQWYQQINLDKVFNLITAND